MLHGTFYQFGLALRSAEGSLKSKSVRSTLKKSLVTSLDLEFDCVPVFSAGLRGLDL